MNYTCGIFEGDDDTLEAAQERKLDWLHDAAMLNPDKRLLDIGCGWGACIEYMATEKGLKDVTGITLSRAQHAEIERRAVPGVNARCISYADYEPSVKFDGVISICMMEHIATPQEVRRGEHIGLYRDYFRRAWEWTNPGSYFGLQTILRNRVPRNRQDLRDIGWVTYKIFPGGLSLRLEDIIMAVNPSPGLHEDLRRVAAPPARKRSARARDLGRPGLRRLRSLPAHLRACLRQPLPVPRAVPAQAHRLTSWSPS